MLMMMMLRRFMSFFIYKSSSYDTIISREHAICVRNITACSWKKPWREDQYFFQLYGVIFFTHVTCTLLIIVSYELELYIMKLISIITTLLIIVSFELELYIKKLINLIIISIIIIFYFFVEFIIIILLHFSLRQVPW